jgi:DNA-damage-inducible protein D
VAALIRQKEADMSEPTANKLPTIDFAEVFEGFIPANVQLVAVQTNEEMADDTIQDLLVAFEVAAKQDDVGNLFWDARDLARLLDYSDYRNFLGVVEKAKESSRNIKIPTEDHFVDATDMIDIGKGAVREVETILLTRYACYLIAQNGDARKRPIAFAQTYFAVQARRQEIQDQENAEAGHFDEDEKRILLRDEMKKHNKMLAEAARNAGVVEPSDFAIFTNAGYRGLYGGLDRAGIQKKKGVKDNILDRMGSTELAANLFKATQTEDKLRRENIVGKAAANRTHFDVGSMVRETIRQIGGTMPEDLPAAENIATVERRINRAITEAKTEV